MTIIRQPSFFSIQELYELEPTQKYDAIISVIDVSAIYHEISKKSRLGAPTELNYVAMIISVFIRYVERIPTMDAGYDYEPIYKQVYQMGNQSVIAYNRRNESEPVGFDRHFEPTCSREHSYRYDSYDAEYETLKYTSPKECKDCPLATEGVCQKVFKMKITTNLRQYTAPARGSKAWEKIYNRRTAVESVNTYLKEFFQLNNVRYRTGKRAKVHFDIVILVYNASKFAVNRINKNLNEQVA